MLSCNRFSNRVVQLKFMSHGKVSWKRYNHAIIYLSGFVFFSMTFGVLIIFLRTWLVIQVFYTLLSFPGKRSLDIISAADRSVCYLTWNTNSSFTDLRSNWMYRISREILQSTSNGAKWTVQVNRVCRVTTLIDFEPFMLSRLVLIILSMFHWMVFLLWQLRWATQWFYKPWENPTHCAHLLGRCSTAWLLQISWLVSWFNPFTWCMRQHN